MALINSWIGYVDRSVEQVKNNLFAKFQALVPEITDHTDSNVFAKMISIWLGISEHLNYYIDNKARETFLITCRKYESAVKIARTFDYRIKGMRASTVDLTFALNVPATSIVNIPIGTIVKTSSDIEFLVTQQGNIQVGQTTIQLKAKQVKQVSSDLIGVGNGLKNQKFELDANIADKSISCVLGSDNYGHVDTFAFSIGTDKVFTSSMNENQLMEVRFGDLLNGFIPPFGQNILASYNVTEGVNGNVGAGLINTIVSTLTLPISTNITVNNIQASSGGVTFESLEDIKKNVPITHRTKLRAVTEKDYKDIAELVNGVGKASVNYKCTKDIPIYIAPKNGGVASLQLLEDVFNTFEDKRLVGKTVVPIAVGEILINIVVSVNAFSNYQNSEVYENIVDNLLDFLSVANQEIKGTIHLSDIYEQIENSKGVLNSNIILMSPIPFARPLDTTVNILNWSKTVKVESVTTVKWNIRFVSTTTFELKRNDIYIGTFAVDTEVSRTEIVFNVIGSHSVNDKFEFYTYPYNSNRIDLVEPSIGVANLSSLNINVTGGI